MFQNSIRAITSLGVAILVIDVGSLQARPITCDFTVTVTQGTLAGNTFNGSFNYDDTALEGMGIEEIGIVDGLTVTTNFLGQDYPETADTDYPMFPKLVFEDGALQHLDFWIESGERILWWGLPGWEIELSGKDCPFRVSQPSARS